MRCRVDAAAARRQVRLRQPAAHRDRGERAGNTARSADRDPPADELAREGDAEPADETTGDERGDVVPHRPRSDPRHERLDDVRSADRRAAPACRGPAACGRRGAPRTPGASATPIVGGTRSRLARRIARGRPIRSESGPQANPPIATASTTTEIERPARDGLTSKSRESSGRIACVEYIVANIPVAPSRNPTSAFRRGSAGLIPTGYAAGVSFSGLMSLSPTDTRPYAAIEQKLVDGTCVILDGGTATELQRALPATIRGANDDLWGSWALYRAPEAVLDAHRAYVAAGCDVVSTNTWSVLAESQASGPGAAGLLHWMDIARTGIRLARTAAAEVGRPRAVAFSLSEDAEVLSRSGTTKLLSKIFEDEQPDLILLETLSLIREPETFYARRGAPRARTPRLGLVSPLSPRRLRRLRPTLGPAGG